VKKNDSEWFWWVMKKVDDEWKEKEKEKEKEKRK
jgi:hypothetical protein